MMKIAQQWKHSGIAGRFICISLLACLFNLSGFSQSLEIPDVEACAGENALIPVIAHDLNDVGAITLYVDFRAENVLYDSVFVINPLLQVSSFNYFVDSLAGEAIAHFAFSWSALTSVDLDDEPILTVQVEPLADTTNFTINIATEIADQTGTPVQTSFTSGSLLRREAPMVLEAPFTAYLFFGYLELSVTATEADAYQWQYLNDTVWNDIVDFEGFSGEATETLTITSLPDGVFAMQVRCAVIGCDSIFTDPTQVVIDIGISDSQPQSQSVDAIILAANGMVSIKPQGWLAGSGYDFSFWSLSGNEILSGSAIGPRNFPTSLFPSGNYLVLLLFSDDLSSKIIKQITILH